MRAESGRTCTPPSRGEERDRAEHDGQAAGQTPEGGATRRGPTRGEAPLLTGRSHGIGSTSRRTARHPRCPPNDAVVFPHAGPGLRRGFHSGVPMPRRVATGCQISASGRHEGSCRVPLRGRPKTPRNEDRGRRRPFRGAPRHKGPKRGAVACRSRARRWLIRTRGVAYEPTPLLPTRLGWGSRSGIHARPQGESPDRDSGRSPMCSGATPAMIVGRVHAGTQAVAPWHQ